MSIEQYLYKYYNNSSFLLILKRFILYKKVIVKEKINLFQEDNNKMRIDIFKGLNESQDFFEKKYNSILSLINK